MSGPYQTRCKSQAVPPRRQIRRTQHGRAIFTNLFQTDARLAAQNPSSDLLKSPAMEATPGGTEGGQLPSTQGSTTTNYNNANDADFVRS